MEKSLNPCILSQQGVWIHWKHWTLNIKGINLCFCQTFHRSWLQLMCTDGTFIDVESTAQVYRSGRQVSISEATINWST